MEASTCLLFTKLCIPPEAWAAWAQAILTVATVWYSVSYQKSFNNLQQLQAEVDRLQRQKEKIDRENDEMKARDQRVIHALFMLRSTMLRFHSNLREAFEGEHESPLAKWHAIRAALGSADTFDLGYDASMFGEMAPTLLSYANTLESAKYLPAGKRKAQNNEEASMVLSDVSPDLRRFLAGLEETLTSTNTLIQERASDRLKALQEVG